MVAALLVVGLGVGVMLLLLTKEPVPPDIRSEFLGFTNMPSGLAARFSLTNYPEGAIFPAVVEMALRENGVWNPVPKPAGGWPSLQLAIGGQPPVVYTLPVPTADVPVRLVMEIRTEPTGWRALVQRLAVLAGRNPNQWHVRLPAWYFTNETAMAEAVLRTTAGE